MRSILSFLKNHLLVERKEIMLITEIGTEIEGKIKRADRWHKISGSVFVKKFFFF